MDYHTVYIDPDLMEIIPGYLENIHKYYQDIQHLLTEVDYQEIRRIGHGLKGSGRGYGFSKITEYGAQLETAATEKNPDQIKEISDKLLDYVNTIRIVSE